MPSFSLNEEEIKKAFQKVKDEITTLKAEISQNKDILESLKKEIEWRRNTLKETPQESFSKGNEGGSKHAVSTQEARSKHAITIEDQNLLKKDYISFFSALPQYEFKTFLAIYQLDEENGRANYYELALKLGISYGCVGGYISSLLRKNAPIIKTKLNKNRTVLSIDHTFKALNPYQTLLDLYYQRFKFDNEQVSLSKF